MLQRKLELSQRNQEVRKINASKAVNCKIEDKNNIPASSQGQQSSAQMRRRSQSCIEYSNKKAGGTAQTSDRRQHNSQGRQQVMQVQNKDQQVANYPKQKPIPQTTTNVNSRQMKPRSLLGELTDLTLMIEKELGRDTKVAHRQTHKLNGSGIQKCKSTVKGAGRLNDTVNESNAHDKTALSALLLGGLSAPSGQAKKSQKVHSYKVQKFIERKKREELVKKGMEQTIEVDRQLKIQQNLHNLDKYVKKHRKGSAVGVRPSKSVQKRHRKNKTYADPIPGLSDMNFGITEKMLPGMDNQEISAILGGEPLTDLQNTQLIDSYRKHQGASQTSSLFADSHFNPEIQVNGVAGRSNKYGTQKFQTTTQGGKASYSSGLKQTVKPKKPVQNERVKESTAATRTTSGTVGAPRKSTFQNRSLQPVKQTSVPMAPVVQMGNPPAQKQSDPSSFQFLPSGDQESKPNQYTSNDQVNDSYWLAKKHPVQQDVDLRRASHPTSGSVVQKPVSQMMEPDTQMKDASQSQTVPKQRQQVKSAPKNQLRQNQLQNPQNKILGEAPHQQTESERHANELVSVYRCKFKPTASEASSILRTLNSAASVIQIHFRYRKQLRQARQKPQGPEERLSFLDSSGKESKNMSNLEYVDTTSEKNKNSKNESYTSSIHQNKSLKQQSQHSNKLETSEGQLQFGSNLRKKQIIQEKLLYEGEPFTQAVPSDLFYGKVQIVQEEYLDTQGSKQGASPALAVDSSQRRESLTTKQERNRDDNKFGTKGRPSINVEAIEEEHRLQNLNQSSNDALNKSPLTSDLKQGGLKTPQVPGLDLKKLHSKKSEKVQKIEIPEEKQQRETGPYDQKTGKSVHDHESTYSQQTVSSYRGIFNRMGLPLPRSARVKVDLQLLYKDPKISEQLKEIVHFKDLKGRQIMEEGKRENLISERTYLVQSRKLEKWVNSTKNKIDESNKDNMKSKQKIQNNLELIQDAEDNKNRLQKVMYEGESGRQHSYLSQSWRAGLSDRRGGNRGESHTFSQNPSYRAGAQSNKGDTFTDRDPYGHGVGGNGLNNQNLVIGSGRQQKSKLIELIQGDTSRSSNKPKQDHTSSDSKKQQENSSYGVHDSLATEALKLEDVKIQIQDYQPKPEEAMQTDEAKKDAEEQIGHLDLKTKQGSPQAHQRTEKSLNHSQSYPIILNEIDQEEIEHLNENSGEEDNSEDNSENQEIDPDQIEVQLEDALFKEQRKEKSSFEFSPIQDGGSQYNSKVGTNQNSEESSANHNLEDLRDPRFFINKLDEDPIDMPTKTNPFNQGQRNEDIELSQQKSDTAGALSFDRTAMDSSAAPGSSLSEEKETKLTTSLFTDQQYQPIKVENQSQDNNGRREEPIQIDQSQVLPTSNVEQSILAVKVEDLAPGHPNSPQSDSQAFEFSKIQTGAHSLSSTDSDMAKAIHAANKDVLDSPPNLISPKGNGQPLLQVMDQQLEQSEQMMLADHLSDYLLASLLQEIKTDLVTIIPRPSLLPQRMPSIKFFEKKGIKTDLFAIEKYVDEIQEEVKLNRAEFMAEIDKPLSKVALDVLFQMQSSEIGSYDHFKSEFSPALNLDLYLRLEKRRKESRDNLSASRTSDGFDFENINEEELKEDKVDKNYLAECQHIHNKLLFDCINDSLQQFRPHGKDGVPQMWSTQGRKLKPTEGFSLEEMFEITKHDLFRMAIMQAGTLPRREFVFGGQFDDELFAEIREKKLATLLCREIVENEPQWLKWDFEEAQTKMDISDMVLESLVTETIEFLNIKNKEKSSAQSQFEELQKLIQSK